LAFVLLFSIPLALNVGCSESSDGGGSGGTAGDGGSGGSAGGGGSAGSGGGTAAPEPYAANICIGDKQAAAGAFCKSVLEAWATWAGDQNAMDPDAAMDRDAAIAAAQGVLDVAWDAAETGADDDGADCSDRALTSEDAGASTEAGISRIVGAINMGLDLGELEQAQCGADLITAAAEACGEVLAAESTHISDLWADTDGATLEAAITAAFADFASAWAEAVSGTCPSSVPTDEAIADELRNLTGALVRDTIISPELLDTEYTTLEPESTVEYLGRIYEPQCMQGDQYRYFARRGSVNKLLMYYMGGGACWDGLTCGDAVGPTCNTTADLDLNEGDRGGFGDLSNDANPFQDWHTVFVTYCSCDIHFGDATRNYPGMAVPVEHKGYHNAKVAERWAREHFYNPEEIFVTGSSAGAYGAWFNAPLLHEVWPASQIHVLADAGNGVITPEFLQGEFNNWDFVKNLPDIPGVEEAITTGDGMPAYTEAVADFFPDTNWAHYSTMFDGGIGGQTGFYNIMLNGAFSAATWWNASCEWGEKALAQSIDTDAAVIHDNYRFYFGTGSKHTMFGNNKVYRDTMGGVPTVVDWINAMLASRPGAPDDGWTNIECEDCGLLLEGTMDDPSDTRDPRPTPDLLAPFMQDGNDVRVVCPEP